MNEVLSLRVTYCNSCLLGTLLCYGLLSYGSWEASEKYV